MNDKNKKDGISVKEIEGYAKNYRFEIFFCALFAFATLFSLIFWGATLSLFLAGIGGIVGALLAEKAHQFAHKMSSTVMSKGSSFQLIVGLVALLVAIFLAPIVFFALGVHGGKSMMRRAKKAQGSNEHHE